MPFRISNLVPRVSAHSERDLFAWSLLAGTVLLCLLAMPFFSGGLYTADDLGNFHLPARAFYADNWPAARPSIGCRASTRVLSHRRRASGRRTIRCTTSSIASCRLQAAMGWEYLLSYPLMLSGMYFLLRRRLAAARRGNGRQPGLHLFQLQPPALRPSQRGGGRGPHSLAAGDDRHHAGRCQAVEGGPRPGVFRAAYGIATAVGLSAICLVLAAGRSVFRGVPGRHAEVCSPRRLRGDAGLPRLRRLPARNSIVARRRWPRRSACLVGAVQLLPTLDALWQSTLANGESPEGATLHPINLVQLIAPYMPIDRAFGGSAQSWGFTWGPCR